MNSTVLALLLLSSLNALPDRSALPQPGLNNLARQEKSMQIAPPRQPTDQATRLAAKGRLPQDRLQLRMDRRFSVAQAAE